MLNDFYVKTTKCFNVYCYIDKVLQDISNDTVSIIFKNKKDDYDEDAIIAKDADVVTNGEKGIAEFTLSIEDTDVPIRNYYYEIKWTLQTGEVYILDSDTVKVLERVFD